MVRGGARDAWRDVKGQAKKSTAVAGKQSSVSTPIVPTSKVKAQKQPACIPSCVTCGTVITDQVKALQCDRCQSADKWKCADCLNLPPEMYDHLVSDPNCSLRWFCLVCDKSAMDVNGSSDHHSEEKFGKLTTSVENLLHKLSSLMERYEAMEQRLDEKCNVTEVTKLESRLTALESKIFEAEHALARVSTVGDRVNKLEQNISSKTTGNDEFCHGILSDEDLIKQVVQVELSKKSTEDQDVEVRKRNIIIHHVPEKKSDNVEERKANDLVFVTDLLDAVFNIKLEQNDIDKMFRLGRWSADKARPLLVGFRDMNHKETIMTNLKNLKNPIEKFRRVGISPDLHPAEREEIRKMVNEAKQAHIASEEEDVGNFKFLVVGKGQRRKVIKIKRNNSSFQG